MEFLTAQDWADFEAKHPAARAFLLQRQVRNEGAYLLRQERGGRITPHEAKRLGEFRAILGAEGVLQAAEVATLG